jgi:hypothetical protein
MSTSGNMNTFRMEFVDLAAEHIDIVPCGNTGNLKSIGKPADTIERACAYRTGRT